MASALSSTSLASASASDARAMDVLRDPTASALRAKAAADPHAAIKAAAKQFEALFMQQLMKSMRDTTLSNGMLDNEGTKMGTELLDSQFASQMTGMRGGLSEAIARQLEKQMSGTPASAAAPVAAAGAAGAPAGGTDTGSSAITQSQADFVRQHQASALAAQAQSGIPAAFMVAQAAHESGWGQREIRNADGTSAHNLFGIKANADWKGPVAQVTTTEYTDGQPHKVTANFRAYASDAESFQDYAQLMKNSPRYSKIATDSSTAQGFAQGLQQAGYATDPTYAAKLTRVINTTLRVQRAGA
jgi:peptidoglycan hydrolase FlgJ